MAALRIYLELALPASELRSDLLEVGLALLLSGALADRSGESASPLSTVGLEAEALSGVWVDLLSGALADRS
nr:hypothetical protein [Candidatus Anoxychlamydiales bacterium]